MTNMGIILPDDGYLDRAARADPRARHAADHRRDAHVLRRARAAARRRGTWTPTSSSSARRSAAACRPARSGMTEDLVDRLFADADADYEDTGGVGGTLAGNALSSAAMRATLEHTLHADAFAQMIPLATRFAEGVQGVIDAHERPVERHAARLPRRVPVPARAGAQRHRRRRLARRGPGALPAPARAEPRRDDHAVPQHGADVPAQHGRPTWTATPRCSTRPCRDLVA